MFRFLLAAAAAFALSVAAPSRACDDCKNCPHAKTAAAEKAGKGDKKDVVACPCGDGKDCKCPAKCECPHCHAKKAAQPEEKKS
jgi:hypothetical protein